MSVCARGVIHVALGGSHEYETYLTGANAHQRSFVFSIGIGAASLQVAGADKSGPKVLSAPGPAVTPGVRTVVPETKAPAAAKIPQKSNAGAVKPTAVKPSAPVVTSKPKITRPAPVYFVLNETHRPILL